MPVDSPEADEYNYKDGYWRCGRNDGCAQKAGWATDHVGVGACKLHGGAGGAPTGPDNGNWKHGLNSQVFDEEDQALLDAVQEMERAEMLRETLDLQMTKLYRAIEAAEDTERANFWEALSGLMDRVEDPTRDELRELAKMLGQNERAIREQIELIIKNAEKLDKIADGETLNVNHDTGEGLEELKEMADDLM